MITFLGRFAQAIIFSALGLCVFFIGLFLWGSWHDEWSGYNASLSVSDGVCNIAVVPVYGDIVPFPGVTYEDGEEVPTLSANPSDVLTALGNAKNDPAIKGVLALVDSYGGAPVASESMANGFKNAGMPVAALIREGGTSGGYLAASGAQTIIASPFSDVGSIGMTMSYLDNSMKNYLEGVAFVSLSSAKFKDYGNPDKPLTEEERALLERDLKIYHDEFVKQVATNRNMSIEEVNSLADGSSMPGAMALEKKLIDALGDQETARDWFAGQLGIPREEVVFCQSSF